MLMAALTSAWARCPQAGALHHETAWLSRLSSVTKPQAEHRCDVYAGLTQQPQQLQVAVRGQGMGFVDSHRLARQDQQPQRTELHRQDHHLRLIDDHRAEPGRHPRPGQAGTPPAWSSRAAPTPPPPSAPASRCPGRPHRSRRVPECRPGVCRQASVRPGCRKATSPDVEGITGRFFVKRKEVETAPHTTDAEHCDRLWNESARLTELPQTP
jgi:hypothetical protein